MPRAVTVPGATPRSVLPPLRRHDWIDDICGMYFSSNCVCQIGWSIGSVTIGYFVRGSTRPI